MRSAQRVIAKFGGRVPLSQALGHRNPSTVQFWAESGHIPARRHKEVYSAALEMGIELTAEDFVDLTEIEGCGDAA